MSGNVESLLLSARAADRELWRHWAAAEGWKTYVPPDGVFFIDPITDASLEMRKAAADLMVAGAAPIPNGAAVLSGEHPLYLRVMTGDAGRYLLLAASWGKGRWLPWPAAEIWWNGQEFTGGISARWSVGVASPDHFDMLEALYPRALRHYILATMCFARERRSLSPIRRRQAAKAGWIGVRYEVIDLSKPLSAPSCVALGGSHASPAFHWVLSHVRRLRSGKEIRVKAFTRGDPARGVIIKDWAREAGLAA